MSALKKNKEEVEVCVVITENFKRGMNNKYYIFTSKIQNIQEVCKSRMLKSESWASEQIKLISKHGYLNEEQHTMFKNLFEKKDCLSRIKHSV